MKLVKILGFVRESFNVNPTFRLLMSDGNEYISNGCQWFANTPEAIAGILKHYPDARDAIDEVLASDPIELEDLPTCYGMFWGCSELTEFKGSFTNVVEFNGMFIDCVNLKTVEVDIPKVLQPSAITFRGCNALESVTIRGESVEIFNTMFRARTSLKYVKLELPKVEHMIRTFYGCESLVSVDFTPVTKIRATMNVTNGCPDHIVQQFEAMGFIN